MGFQEKLDRMCVAADREAKRQLARHTKDLAALVAAVLRSKRWGDLSLKTQRLLEETAEAACNAAELADAAEFTNDRLLAATNGRVVDLTLKQDLRAMQEQIYSLFESREAPHRGFVYVAWSARPECFMYVGKAKQVDRLNLAVHGKLSHAAAHCTKLSLLFPTQSLEKVLFGLEASVCKLVEHCSGDRPELNDRKEIVPTGRASAELTALSTFLTGVAKQVHIVY
jgi:hypothetical protein